MVHVLDVRSSSYTAILASAGDDFLAGCRCAGCQGSDLRLTRRRVRRRLETRDAFVTLPVALARCRGCRRRERVLPCDALPGKVTGVDVVLDAASSVLADGSTMKAVAAVCGVAARTVRSWILGLGGRVLDLEQLYRHRAGRAPPDASATAVLHRWATIRAELWRVLGAEDPPTATDVRRSAVKERREAAARLVRFIARAGGADAVAALGAAWFRQAVLLFRGYRAGHAVFLCRPAGWSPASVGKR